MSEQPRIHQPPTPESQALRETLRREAFAEMLTTPASDLDDEYKEYLLNDISRYTDSNGLDLLVDKAWLEEVVELYGEGEISPEVVSTVLASLKDVVNRADAEEDVKVAREIIGGLRDLHKGFIEHLGLPWKDSSGRISLYDVATDSVDGQDEPMAEAAESVPDFFFTAGEIERQAGKGSVATLHKEFGVSAFHRYDIETLVSQYEDRNNQDISYGVWIMPYRDENGTFADMPHEMEYFRKQKSETPTTRVIEARNGLDAFRKLARLHARYPEQLWKFGVVAGHGWEEEQGIAFQNTVEDHPTKKLPGGVRQEHLQGPGVKRLGEYFDPEAEIVLSACDLGRPDGFAEELSKQFGRTVTAAETSINYSWISLDNNEETDVPKIRVRYEGKDGEDVEAKRYSG